MDHYANLSPQKIANKINKAADVLVYSDKKCNCFSDDRNC